MKRKRKINIGHQMTLPYKFPKQGRLFTNMLEVPITYRLNMEAKALKAAQQILTK